MRIDAEVPRVPGRVAVLTYHDVTQSDPASGYTVSRRGLQETLGAALARGGAVTCEVTFDDGRAGTFLHGLPVLHARGITSTLFVAVGLLGRPGFMDRAMVRAWFAAGQRVGSHAITHRPLKLLSLREARLELRDSRVRLEDLIGAPVDAFAFPGGNDSARLRAAALEAGYARVYTSEPAFARADSRVLPRFAIRATTPVDAIRALREGRFPRAFAADRLRFALKRAIGVRLYLALRARARAGRRERTTA